MNRNPFGKSDIAKPMSIFRVTTYEYKSFTRKRTHYPSFRLRVMESSFYHTLKQAEKMVADRGRIHRLIKEK